MWQTDTEQSEALEQMGTERPDVLVLIKKLHGVCESTVSSRLVIENAKRKKNVRLAPSMNLSSMTAPDYGKMCPNFWLGEN